MMARVTVEVSVDVEQLMRLEAARVRAGRVPRSVADAVEITLCDALRFHEAMDVSSVSEPVLVRRTAVAA